LGAPKVTKSACQQKCFFAALASALQIRQNLGCNLLALLRSLGACASAKSCYALQPQWPPLFCLISPEAYLLTGKEKTTPTNRK
jgi:hypothetical protein